MRSGFRLSCTLVLVVLACATHRLPAQDATEPAPRSYYMELSFSGSGRYDAPRLTGEGSFPLYLFPGRSIRAARSEMPAHLAASPAVEIGTLLHGREIWAFAAMEFHPVVRDNDDRVQVFGPAERASMQQKTIRGNSVTLGMLFEQPVLFRFFGLYGRAAVGYYSFDQTVLVIEQSATDYSETVHETTASGLGGALGIGAFFNFWGVRIRLGFRTYYVGGNGSVSSSDFRLAIAYVM